MKKDKSIEAWNRWAKDNIRGFPTMNEQIAFNAGWHERGADDVDWQKETWRKDFDKDAKHPVDNTIGIEMEMLIKIWNRLEWYAETPLDFQLLAEIREYLIQNDGEVV
jgi:hypothetical protein